MARYRLEILEPDEQLRHRRKFPASDDAEAIKQADELWRQVAEGGGTLDRYVLYEGDRVVHEHVAPKPRRGGPRAVL
jgi:hypothetical protein